MSDRLRGWLERIPQGLRALAAAAARAAAVPLGGLARGRTRLAAAAVLALCVFALYAHPPFASVPRGQILVRTNLLDGSAQAYTAGTVLVLPGIHQVRRFSTRDQVYRPARMRRAPPAPRRSSRTRDCRSAST